MSLCVAKKLPSCAWVFNMYDKNNRLIFIQDGDQRQRGEWVYSIPDAFGRTSVVGVCRNTFNVFNQSIKDQQIIVCPDFNEAFGYAIKNDVIELFNPTVLEVNYYDNYDFLTNDYFDHSDLTYNLENGFDKRFYSDKAVGLMTGHLKAVMNKEAIAGYLSSIMYYDYRGRQVQMKSTNQLINGFEKEYFAYDFIGQLLKRKHVHSSKDQAIQTEQYSYTYDRAGRALMTTHQLNGNPPILLMDNKYDAIGRLKYNSRNGGVNLRTDYAYNLRSWVKSLNTPIFSQTLYYQDNRGGDGNIIPSYSGNISSMDWAWFSPGGDAKQHGYDFTYDCLSRLTSADYLEDGACNGHFSTSYAYDKHGNLSSLKRSGTKVSGGYGLLDDLTLSYRGNQLKNVADKSLSQGSPVCMSFEDGSAQDVEYTYDANGNLTKDLNKKILNIQYNYLNLPSRIVFENGNAISYVYGADGTKLRTTHVIGNDTTVNDYCGNVIYENGTPVKLLTEGGYVTLNDHKYHYFIQDHQGNNRLVVDEDGVVEEKNDYYPFGGLMSSSSGSVQPYKYNGKELDRKGGLDWYDYGARMYDAALGRWHVMDPMAEKYYGWSPYNYCANNPIKNVDPDGKQVIPIPMPYAPLPFYSPITYHPSYNLPSDQQIMRHASGKFAEIGQIITNAPRMSLVFGSLLYYQAKKAISPEFDHQRKRDRRGKEELDRNQANIAKSIDANVSGMMPNGDPAPKRELSISQKIVLGVVWGAVAAKDYHDNFSNDNIQEHPKDLKHDKYIDKEKEQENDLILNPIKDRLDEEFKKNW